jgi:hypothetical protein
MARFIIFCGTRAAIERYDMAGVPILVYQYRERFEEILKVFAADPNGQLAVHMMPAVMGFHVPSDTFTVFDASWRWDKDHPNTIQALGRVLSRFTPPTNSEALLHQQIGRIRHALAPPKEKSDE